MPRRSSHREERLRIVPRSVWDDARSRQLIARVALNRDTLLQAAAGASGCFEIGSGGRLRYWPTLYGGLIIKQLGEES
jgi:hypothetical protein